MKNIIPVCFLGKPREDSWVADQELELTYYSKETLEFFASTQNRICNLIQAPKPTNDKP